MGGSVSSRIPFIRPIFPESSVVAQDFDAIVASGRFSNFGPREREFTAMVAAYVGPEYSAVSFANATLALIACIEATLGQGDGTRSILVASFTFAAGPEATQWAGYRPFFIDIEAIGLQPSLSEAKAIVADDEVDVAAILLTNSFGIGNPAIDAWCAWGEEHGLPVIIDSAAGFGSLYADGSRVGGRGVAEIFSFHATKPFAIGEGGAVVTRDGVLASRLASLANFGFGSDGKVLARGFNAKLTEFAAAIGIRQFERFDGELESRRRTMSRYAAELASSGYVSPANIQNSAVCFGSLVAPSAEARHRALLALDELSVDARCYYAPPLHRHPYFDGVGRRGALPVTEDICARVVSVPVHPHMDDDAVGAVIAGLARGAHP